MTPVNMSGCFGLSWRLVTARPLLFCTFVLVHWIRPRTSPDDNTHLDRKPIFRVCWFRRHRQTACRLFRIRLLSLRVCIFESCDFPLLLVLVNQAGDGDSYRYLPPRRFIVIQYPFFQTARDLLCSIIRWRICCFWK